jgi:hypothetical protein
MTTTEPGEEEILLPLGRGPLKGPPRRTTHVSSVVP